MVRGNAGELKGCEINLYLEAKKKRNEGQG